MAELTLAELAEITLRLERGEPRLRVLAERGLSEEEWLDQQMLWLSRMAAQVERQRHALYQRYLDVREVAAENGAPAGAAAPTTTAFERLVPDASLDRGAGPGSLATTTAFAPAAPPPLYAAQARPAPAPPPLHVTAAHAPEAYSAFAPAAVPAPIAFAPPPHAPAVAPIATPFVAPPVAVASPPVERAPAPAPTAPPAEVRVAASPPVSAPQPVSAAAATPRLALQQLALLVADLTVFPERSRATLEQSGLDPSSWQAEWNAWQLRFANDPAERGRYDPLVAYYMALIRPR